MLMPSCDLLGRAAMADGLNPLFPTKFRRQVRQNVDMFGSEKIIGLLNLTGRQAINL
jgi:hypothetical protein